MDSVNDPAGLAGIDPSSLTAEEREAVNSLVNTDEEDFELLDSEIMASLHALHHLNEKYSSRPATHDTLVSIGNEAQFLFNKIGLRVLFDWSPIISGDSPVLSIEGRINKFDPERQGWEVKRGVADEVYSKR